MPRAEPPHGPGVLGYPASSTHVPPIVPKMSTSRRRIVPWALLTVLLVATSLAVVLGTHQSSITITPADLKSELLTSTELGRGWHVDSFTGSGESKDTWISPTCWKFTTKFGGPVAEVRYTRNGFGIPLFQETIERTTASPQTILDMMVRCGYPHGSPGSIGGVRLKTTSTPLRILPLASLGQGYIGIVSYPLKDRKVRDIYGIAVQGNDLLNVTYVGADPLAEVRAWAAEAVAQVNGD